MLSSLADVLCCILVMIFDSHLEVAVHDGLAMDEVQEPQETEGELPDDGQRKTVVAVGLDQRVDVHRTQVEDQAGMMAESEGLDQVGHSAFSRLIVLEGLTETFQNLNLRNRMIDQNSEEIELKPWIYCASSSPIFLKRGVFFRIFTATFLLSLWSRAL